MATNNELRDTINSGWQQMKNSTLFYTVLATSFLGGLVYWTRSPAAEKPAPAAAAPAPTLPAGFNGHGVIPTAPAQPVAGLLPAPAAAPTPPIAAATAQQLSFVVASAGMRPDGSRKYLNSTADFKLPGNNAIVLVGNAAKMLNQDTYIGKAVTAVGTATRNRNGGTDLIVSDPSQIR